MWQQSYDPFANPLVSTAVAAVPLVALLAIIASGRTKPHVAAALGLVMAVSVAILAYGMPAALALRAAGFGMLTGFFPIGWIVLNVLFLYRLTVDSGLFQVLHVAIARISPDRRLQVLLVAFCFGAFIEGAAGFGTPVALTAAILIGLGFSPLAAAGLSLIANTAPVAFGAMGAPVQGLASATGLDPYVLGRMIGRQLPLFSLIVPFWLICAQAGIRRALDVWPAILVCGASFAITQFLVSNFVNPWIVDMAASTVAMVSLAAFLRVWQPAQVWTSTRLNRCEEPAAVEAVPPTATGDGMPAGVLKAALPWLLLCVTLTAWASPPVKKLLDALFAPSWPVPGLHELVQRLPPIVAQPIGEAAVFKFTALSYTGTGVLLAAVLTGFGLRHSPLKLVRMYGATLWLARHSLLTIAMMLALGTLTRFSGADATLGLAFAATGFFYPFFGTLLGWVGVAATGSDTASNVLFGGLQKITAGQLGISPVLMAAANSSGGVMGKMIDTQSIVVASTATGQFGQESRILRFVFWHSVVLACLVGVLVMLQAYVPPFTRMVVE